MAMHQAVVTLILFAFETACGFCFVAEGQEKTSDKSAFRIVGYLPDYRVQHIDERR